MEEGIERMLRALRSRLGTDVSPGLYQVYIRARSRKMKYDIYKGTKKDMEESDGKLYLPKCSRTQVKEFCRKRGFAPVTAGKFLGGDYLPAAGDSGYWLEEAM